MDNGLSFVRDFERLLGKDFFRKVASFTSMRTDGEDLERELVSYVEKLESLGGIDLFFLGLGPEAGAASHLCYIKPGSGATYTRQTQFDQNPGLLVACSPKRPSLILPNVPEN